MPLLIVDAANVVGSVPDGWWHDRAAATMRLRDALADVATQGLPDGSPDLAAALEVVLVVEGAARGVEPTAAVAVVTAPGSGDDTIVDLVREVVPGRPVAVLTSDRALRARVTALGASALGPSALPHRRARRWPDSRPPQ